MSLTSEEEMTRAKMNMKSKSAVSTQKGKALKVSLRNTQIFRNLALNNKIKVGETVCFLPFLNNLDIMECQRATKE